MKEIKDPSLEELRNPLQSRDEEDDDMLSEIDISKG
jgi:hypothetical protein